MGSGGVYAFHLPLARKIKLGRAKTIGFRLGELRAFIPDAYLLAHTAIDDHDERVKREREIKEAFGIRGKTKKGGELVNITPANIKLIFENYEVIGDVWDKGAKK